MTHPSPFRAVSLFSPQARAILREPLYLGASSTRSRELDELAVTDWSDDVTTDAPVVGAEEPRGVVSECLSCHVTFDVRADQVAHYRLDWHRYNLKRKLRGLTHITQEVFEVEAGDLSSISGSESDSDECSVQTTPTNSTRHSSFPFVYFTSGDSQTVYSIYRVTLTGGKEYTLSSILLPSLLSLLHPPMWVVLMQAGGHFAGAVFSGSTVVVHKTFHRYTVRAKRGTSQSVRDSQSGGHGPRSAGASLRRYNEAALELEVQELLASWSAHVKEANAIFIRAPKNHQSIFTGGRKPPLSKDDPRIRGIPFVTRRPTLKEVKRVHSCLASIYIGSGVKSETVPVTTVARATNNEPATANIPQVLHKNSKREGEEEGVESGDGDGDSGVGGEGEGEGGGRRRKKTKKKKKVDKVETGCIQPAVVSPAVCLPPALSQLLCVCERRGEEGAMETLLHGLGLSQLYGSESVADVLECDCTQQTACSSDSGQLEISGHESGQENTRRPDALNVLYGGVSPLHIASEHGHAVLVEVLLNYGANPTIRDSAGRVPYLVAKEKPVRDCYRRFMAQQPMAYDYAAAQIPSPLTEDMERERREKAAEKKREKKRHTKKKRSEEKSRKEEEEVQRKRSVAVGELSEREKRALAAEKRLALQLSQDSSVQRAGVCSCCGRSLAGLVPFHRLQYHYCSMPCVREHRTQL